MVVTPAERAEALDLVDAAWAAGELAHGRLTAAFEAEFGRHAGCAAGGPDRMEAVAVGSGTQALEAVFRHLGVAGKAVLCPANTFYATAAAAYAAGAARVEFVDCRPGSMHPGLLQVDAAVRRCRDAGERIGALCWVHLGGVIDPAVEAVAAGCREEYGVPLVEDAAHAHGSTFRGRSPGAWGEAACYSFYPTKVVTAGEGGMVVSRHRDVLEYVRAARNFYKPGHGGLGFNWRIPEASAALGAVQSKALPEIRADRAGTAALYAARLGRDPRVRLHLAAPDGTSAYYKIPLTPADTTAWDRDRFRSRLAALGVGLAGGVYDTPLTKIPALCRGAAAACPNAEWWARTHACLPVYRGMTAAEVDRVCEAVEAAL